MFAIISLFLILALSLLVTRIATVALIHTGLSRETARFQARSAFTGSGFTTAESEKVVGHPVRRRIVMLLMLLGNAGIITAVSSLILTFVGQHGTVSVGIKIVLLVTVVVVLWSLSVSRWVDRHLSYLIERALRSYTRLDVRDYASLLHLAGEYRVSELMVQRKDWLANKSLKELRLVEEGILVLGVERPDGTFIGAPDGTTQLQAGDTVVVYGLTARLEDLDTRRRGRQGERQHGKAVSEHEQMQRKEKQADATHHTERRDSGRQ